VRFWNVVVLVLAFAPSVWSEPPASVSAPNADSAESTAAQPDLPPALTPAPHLLAAPVTERGAQVNGLIAHRQLAAAEKIINLQLAAAPQDPEWLTLAAEVRIDQGREGEAVVLLEKANRSGGVTALRSMLIGLAECLWNRTDLAEPEFRTAIRLDPFNPVPHYFLARLLYNNKSYEEAIQESKNAISLSPNFVRAYENLGLCYEGRRQLQDAEHSYMEAIRQDASHTQKTEWPSLDLGNMLIHENRLAEAKPYLEQALAINPKNPQSLEGMGLLRERMGDFKGALEEFKAAINVDPKRKTAYYQASRMAREVGQADQSMQYLDKFQQLREAEKKPLEPPKPPSSPKLSSENRDHAAGSLKSR
jgi:tetratricopeptide (TPR) repeat protein